VNTTTFAAPGPAETSSALKNTVILVIRHAEKPASGDTLSAAGEAHAQAYVNYFKHFSIDGQPHQPDRLFAAKDSSASDRSCLTLDATAKALGLAIDSHFNDNQFLELAQQLKSSPHGTNILICWHHGNIPQLLNALGADPGKLLPKAKWPDAVFGWLIQLRYDETGQLFDSKRLTEDFTPASGQPEPEPAANPNGAAKPEPDTNSVAKPGPETNSVAKPPTRIHQGGGIDPHGDSLVSIQHSLQQFAHAEFLLRLFLSLMLAAGCAWVVAWNPRCSSQLNSPFDLEERKTLILLGVVGAIIAELSGTSQTLAFVIFGIGALLRFRTVLDNPKLTGKAITVVAVGLACGMGSWAMAVFVTIFTWILIYWLDSHIACQVEIRLAKEVDPKPVFGEVQSFLASRHCRLKSAALYKGKRQMVFLLHIPADLDLRQLELDVRAKLPASDDAQIKMEVA
jgi:hypothetical protein